MRHCGCGTDSVVAARCCLCAQWHLGDLWPKTNLKGHGNKGYGGNFSSPTQHGFDEWLMTEAEASNSMPK